MSARTLPASIRARTSRSPQPLLSILSQRVFQSPPFCVACLSILCSAAGAQDAPAPAADVKGAVEQASTVVIFGQGQTRQVQNITRSDLAKALPGSSPLMTLEKLPGVSFQSADAFGAYEWSTRFSVRGFSQGQLGFTLDNVPLGNMSYGNSNGLHISRAISPENIAQVDLSQGAGAVGTASTSNLGGTVQFMSSEPADTFAVSASQTVGSNRTQRGFVRVDSGLHPSGLKAYFSATRQRAVKWKGEGPQDQDQINTKVLGRFGAHQFSAFYNYSDRSENDYQDLSLDMQKRLGWDWDNYAPDWQRAVAAATLDPVTQKYGFQGAVNNLDDGYYTARGLRKDHLAGATLVLALGAGGKLNSTLYHHGNQGQGHWYTPYTPSPTVPISIRTTEYAISRNGVIGELVWELGRHTVNGGVWLEQNEHTLTRNFYAVSGPADTNYFLSNPMLTGFKQVFDTRTTQLYLQDTMLLLDERLKLNAGVKSTHVNINATSINTVRAAGTLNADKSFLPQFGLNYELNKSDEIFSSVARNLRAFEPGVYGQFSQNQAAFDANGAKLKPETSITFDLGVRFKRDGLTGSVAVYRADFSDRILTVATCAGVVGCPNTVVNVGKVATHGVEAATVWIWSRQWSWFNSFTFNDARYRSDYLAQGAVVNVSGKQVVDSPKRMFTTEMSYDNKVWFGRLAGKYTDKRFYTFVNDGQVPAYWVMHASAGFMQKSLGGFKDVKIELRIDNVLNKRYFSTIGSNQFVASDPAGNFPTLLTGAPRQLFVTISGKL